VRIGVRVVVSMVKEYSTAAILLFPASSCVISELMLIVS
jgi:hypothetical protein